MQTIAPPTDNLYKFLAIGGLVVFIASFVVPKQAEYLLRDKRFRKIAEAAKAKADFEIWVGAEKRLEWERKSWTDRRELLADYMKRHPRDEVADDVARNIIEMNTEVNRRAMDFWKDHEKNAQLAGVADQGIGLMKSTDSEIAFWEGEAQRTNQIFQVCFWVGIIASATGFFTWWRKCQIPQDELLQLELQEKRLASKKSS